MLCLRGLPHLFLLTGALTFMPGSCLESRQARVAMGNLFLHLSVPYLFLKLGKLRTGLRFLEVAQAFSFQILWGKVFGDFSLLENVSEPKAIL